MLCARNQDSGRVAPTVSVHARRLLFTTVKHHGVELIFVASLQSVRSSSLLQAPTGHVTVGAGQRLPYATSATFKVLRKLHWEFEVGGLTARQLGACMRLYVCSGSSQGCPAVSG